MCIRDRVGLGHGNLAAMLLSEETKCFCFLAGHESFAAAEGAIGIAKTANKVRKTPLKAVSYTHLDVYKRQEDTNAAGYLQKKADELALRLANLESQASALSDEINGVLSSFSQLKKKTQAAKEQFNEYGQKYKELKQSREAERSAIEKELAALEKSVDAALMEKYKAKRKDKMLDVYKRQEPPRGGISGKRRAGAQPHAGG